MLIRARALALVLDAFHFDDLHLSDCELATSAILHRLEEHGIPRNAVSVYVTLAEDSLRVILEVPKELQSAVEGMLEDDGSLVIELPDGDGNPQPHTGEQMEDLDDEGKLNIITRSAYSCDNMHWSD